MKVRISGAHNVETKDTGSTSVLIDNTLAIDVGTLSRNLSFKETQNLKAVLLSHRHYDHIKDIPMLGMAFFMLRKTLKIYTTQEVYEFLTTHLINETVYPDFTKRPAEKPTLIFKTVEPGKSEQIDGYSVLPVKVNHAVPTVGYQITASDGKKVFMTSDTGPGLEECWQQIAPDLLLIETTLTNRNEEFANNTGHLTPALLQKELESFRKIRGYLPRVVLMHMNPLTEDELKREVSDVEKALDTQIQFGKEGMEITV